MPRTILTYDTLYHNAEYKINMLLVRNYSERKKNSDKATAAFSLAYIDALSHKR